MENRNPILDAINRREQYMVGVKAVKENNNPLLERVFHDSQIERLERLLNCILKFEEINNSSLISLNTVSAKLMYGVLYDMASLLREVEERIDSNNNKVEGRENVE